MDKIDTDGRSCPHEGFYQFRSKTSELQTLVDFFSSHGDETGFKSATSLISLGAGDGTLDCALIRNSLPMLQEYIGVERDAENYEHMKRNIDECCKLLTRRSGLVMTPVQGCAQQYNRPERSVDVVLMMHLLYYLGDRKGEMIRHALGWLKPGGRLIIGVVGHDDFLQKLANVGSSDLVSWPVRTASELKNLNLTYKEFYVEHEFTYAGCDRKFVDFVLQTHASDAEIAKVLSCLQTLAKPGTDTILHGTRIFVLEKT